MGGRITVESVVRCSWNGWPDDRGIRTELANRRGVTLNRTPEKVPNRWGKRCRVPRYSVPATEREHANAILATLERNALSNRED